MKARTSEGVPSRAAGFSLVELMIVVAIISILAAIAYPGYQRYVTRTHRGAAKACLVQYAQFMERHYTTNLTYVMDDDPELGCATEGGLDDHYTFSVANRTATGYQARATPSTAFHNRDSAKCGTLSIDQQGARGVGTGATEAACW